VVDLTVISGTYVTVAMILSVSAASVPPGSELPFKPGEP
jgi:4-carboxymuconolactone decarboxylase